MRLLFLLFAVISLSFSAKANFLSYDTTTETKQNYKKPQIAKMIKMMGAKVDSQAPTISKTYIHAGKMMIYADGKPQNLVDFPNNRLVAFHKEGEKKTYSVMTPAQFSQRVEQIAENNTDVQSNYIKLKGKKKFSGKICSLYRSKTEINMKGIHKQKGESLYTTASPRVKSLNCIWLKPPAAWVEYQMASLKAFKPQMHKFAKINKGRYTADLGMPLYIKTKTDFTSAAVKDNPQIASMIPETYTIEVVSNISTAPFDPKIVEIPEGYKKFTPKKKQSKKKKSKKKANSA